MLVLQKFKLRRARYALSLFKGDKISPHSGMNGGIESGTELQITSLQVRPTENEAIMSGVIVSFYFHTYQISTLKVGAVFV